MLTVNRATLMGHAGRDPEIRALKGGNRVANFGLATTERWTDREGKPAEATEWHRIVVYGSAVDIVEQRLRKGDPVMVEGRIATRQYQDRDGKERSFTEIVVAGPQAMVNILAPRRAEDGNAADPGPVSGDAAAP